MSSNSLSKPVRRKRAYNSSKVVRIRARSFSRDGGSGFDVVLKVCRRAFRDVVGAGFRALRPAPTTAMYSLDE